MKQKELIFSIAVLLFCGSCSSGKQSLVDYVDPFIGTGFHGHTYPGATVPFGAVQLSPDTRAGNWDACSGYHYDDARLKGFSHTHLSGTGCIDLGDILFRPTTQKTDLTAEDFCPPAIFSHKDEKASVGYYSVILKDEGIKAELTATTHVGMHRYKFPSDKTASVIIDLAHLLDNEYVYGAELEQTAANEITGMRKTRGWTDNQYIYFVAQFSKPFQTVRFVEDRKIISVETKSAGTKLQAVLTFDVKDKAPVIVRVGLSLVSVDNARENLEHEVKDFDFDAVCATARNAWEQALAAITVEGGSADDLKNFYTAMYHTMVVPNTVSDVNGEYRRHDMRVGKLPEGKVQYSTFSLWDTFRAWNPLMTLIDTTLVNNMINSYLDIYDASGELPIWPLSAGETGTMIGYHSASVIADAYLKGIRGFDAEKALEAMVASSEKNKKGADYYIKYGFIPANIKRESVSCLLEFAYDDWCIARMAREMGKMDIYEKYIGRSQNYINVFDGSTKFFRGKRMDGNWEVPFNPLEVGRAYTEATAWQYRFFVPHDVNGMMQLFGGKEAFITALDSIFVTDSTVQGDLVDITGLIGQYAHGNEPSHHIAYLYDYVGQPWKTQEMTRRLLHEMYQPTPEGIVGNEDCGQMSAWYILSSLGIYSVCPGSNEFALTAPLFEKAAIKLANGKRLTILANNPGKNIYISKVELNGKRIDANFITYAQLMEGGELCFTLSGKPDKSRGVSQESSPYSYTGEKVVSIPYVDKDLNLFADKITVAFATTTENASIRYTLDGNEPTEESSLYEKPFELDKTLLIKAKGFKEGFLPSRTLSIMATKAELKASLPVYPVKNGTAYKYFEGVCQKVTDIERMSLLETGIMPEPSIEDARNKDHFGYIFSGLINVPEDGVYTFQTRSDDGSVLYIGDEMVVNNDGSHAAISATGMIALKKGFHLYKLYYFEDYEGEHLSWAWKIPSAKELVPIPASALFVN
ncbi:GH92 family glycosyl hydrolase [Bacteroides helcogenes]|uniref:Alpha-1,2-mannosidase n=1 Tax=Bacteroides helcogenes (strain ATCC 35417 / DSM 20613 / JCM 6297 / CCUG 15421 / P 36-108) TaxID=693979 RepID=E6SRT3_BACT6|nr:GH92 family glycosyl hydrolase [Bacteroides helcogenes]ADV42092.1 alpha-1,2-mannosidase [Bacteroides helcogenes P 36-108]MDY5240039.1 GH92 family glycosyl hydrolase [Bacteroides helcogenes]